MSALRPGTFKQHKSQVRVCISNTVLQPFYSYCLIVQITIYWDILRGNHNKEEQWCNIGRYRPRENGPNCGDTGFRQFNSGSLEKASAIVHLEQCSNIIWYVK